MNTLHRTASLGLSLAALLGIAGQFQTAAGPLAPPAAPASSGVTLSDLQALLASVEAARDPRTPITSLPITINESGSYYLTQDFEIPNPTTDAITVLASDVTIDLNGFAIVGSTAPVMQRHAINTSVLESDITIRNGVLRDWTGYGVTGESDRVRLENLQIANTSTGGIRVRSGGVIMDCVVDSAGSIINNVAINALHDTVIERCTITGSGANAIEVGSHCTVRDCTVTGSAQGGIILSSGAVLDCLVSDSGERGIRVFGSLQSPSLVEGCVVDRSGTDGIVAGANTVVRGCTSANNVDDGIEVGEDCRVEDNHCTDNDSDGNTVGSGIHATGDRNRIDGNSVVGNASGISANSVSDCVVTRNSGTDNPSGNFNVDFVNNTVGMIIVGPGLISGDPWANIAH